MLRAAQCAAKVQYARLESDGLAALLRVIKDGACSKQQTALCLETA
jgi:hypothetical protein